MNRKKSRPETLMVVRTEKVVLSDGKTRDIVCYHIESATPNSTNTRIVAVKNE